MKEPQTNNSGAMCGGVISESLFYSDPMAYMMSYYMEDEKFNEYKSIKDEKEKSKFFERYAISAI